jgi:hypothetical protein
MKLNSRDRAKVNAALVALHDAGHDTGEVTRVAEAIINTGVPSRQAYERAFNKFVERVPSFRAPLQRLGQLIDASDHATVARYNVALSRYIETGDPAAVQAVLPTLQQDMATMAVQTGDAGFAEGLGELPAPAPAPAGDSEASPNQARPGWGALGYSPGSATPVPATTTAGEAIGATPTAARPGWGGEGYSPGAAATALAPIT